MTFDEWLAQQEDGIAACGNCSPTNGRNSPFWIAFAASTFDLAGEQKTDLCELFAQGVAYGRVLSKSEYLRNAANMIDSGATTKDLREIASGVSANAVPQDASH
jgi:hypothetical protein